MQKQCFKCKERKLISDFYKHSRMADGHFNKCKHCAKVDASTYRLGNIEKVRDYDRARGRLPERMKSSAAISSIWRAEDKRR